MAEKVEPHEHVHLVERYSLFTKAEKWYIVFLISFAGWFSTLSSFIYYPAITQVARDLNVTIAAVNLTVTSYMAVSTVAPALVGDAADILGRRVLYLGVLTLYLAANIGIAVCQSFGAVLGLRMLQSAGISGSFSIAYGIVADIAIPAERGSYVSAMSFGITTAPSIGPTLGGALSFAKSWRFIFWFLSMASGFCLALMAFSLPETARNIVENGKIKPPLSARLPFKSFMCHWSNEEAPRHRERRVPNPLKSLKLLLRKDNAALILAGGIIYTVYSCINTALSTQFIKIYDLNQWQAGLIYLPFGLGGTLACVFSGRLIDGLYRRTAKLHSLSTDNVKGDDIDTFPVEEARLKCVSIPVLGAIGFVVAFGWTLDKHLHIAVPLTFQFLAGFSIQICFNVNNTLLVDINRHSPAAAQASSNIVRCTLSAIMVAFLQDLFNHVGVGWAFTFLGLMCSVSAALYCLLYLFGMKWRTQSTCGPNGSTR